MTHKDEECPLVEHRIACEQCGYPFSEAMFDSVDDYNQVVQMAYEEELEWPVYDEAKGG